MTMSTWQVIVGNVGTVYDGKDGFKAKQEYAAYKALSVEGYGRAGNEPVTLMRDGEPVWEHIPKESEDG
jgi:hypothetical protein